jgi:hypothetical protein
MSDKEASPAAMPSSTTLPPALADAAVQRISVLAVLGAGTCGPAPGRGGPGPGRWRTGTARVFTLAELVGSRRSPHRGCAARRWQISASMSALKVTMAGQVPGRPLKFAAIARAQPTI